MTGPKIQTWSRRVLRQAQDERCSPVRGEPVEPRNPVLLDFWDSFLDYPIPS
jgi:hypothetical protein